LNKCSKSSWEQNARARTPTIPIRYCSVGSVEPLKHLTNCLLHRFSSPPQTNSCQAEEEHHVPSRFAAALLLPSENDALSPAPKPCFACPSGHLVLKQPQQEGRQPFVGCDAFPSCTAVELVLHYGYPRCYICKYELTLGSHVYGVKHNGVRSPMCPYFSAVKKCYFSSFITLVRRKKRIARYNSYLLFLSAYDPKYVHAISFPCSDT